MKKVEYRYEVTITYYGEVDLDELGYTEQEWEELDYSEQQNIIDDFIDDEKSEILRDCEKEYEITVY